MRLACLVITKDWGGAERVATTLVREARAAGHTVRVDAPFVASVREGLARELGTTIDGDRRETSLARWVGGAALRVREERPDVVIANLPTLRSSSLAFLVAGARPLTLIAHLLPAPPRLPVDRLLRVRADRVLAVALRLHRRARLVTVSDADAARLGRTIDSRYIQSIPNAPPLPPLAVVRPSEQSIVNTWPPVIGPRLLSIGRLDAQKGFDRMLRALASPTCRALPWSWLVIGDGDGRAVLVAQAAALGVSDRVRFLGAAPGHLYLGAADLVLCPSRFEGMPLVPLEALEAGRPVVLADIAPHREIVGADFGQLLPAQEAEWPPPLGALLADASARDSLRMRQARLAKANGRSRAWQAYERLFRDLARSTWV